MIRHPSRSHHPVRPIHHRRHLLRTADVPSHPIPTRRRIHRRLAHPVRVLRRQLLRRHPLDLLRAGPRVPSLDLMRDVVDHGDQSTRQCLRYRVRRRRLPLTHPRRRRRPPLSTTHRHPKTVRRWTGHGTIALCLCLCLSLSLCLRLSLSLSLSLGGLERSQHRRVVGHAPSLIAESIHVRRIVR